MSASAPSDHSVPDWTRGERGIRFQHCAACQHTWYVARTFCPRCGAVPDDRAASGRGTVAAVSVVARAPTKELAVHAPYAVLLVDADEHHARAIQVFLRKVWHPVGHA